MFFFSPLITQDAHNVFRFSHVKRQSPKENELFIWTHQVPVQFFADIRADFHETHENEETAKKNRKT